MVENEPTPRCRLRQVEVKLRLPGREAHSKLLEVLGPGNLAATHQQVSNGLCKMSSGSQHI